MIEPTPASVKFRSLVNVFSPVNVCALFRRATFELNLASASVPVLIFVALRAVIFAPVPVNAPELDILVVPPTSTLPIDTLRLPFSLTENNWVPETVPESLRIWKLLSVWSLLLSIFTYKLSSAAMRPATSKRISGSVPVALASDKVMAEPIETSSKLDWPITFTVPVKLDVDPSTLN